MPTMRTGRTMRTGQFVGRDFQVASVTARVVPKHALFMGARHHVQAAVFHRRIYQRDPARHDEVPVAMGQEVSRVLVPGHFRSRVRGDLGTDSIRGGAHDVRSDQVFDAVHQVVVPQQVQHFLPAESASAPPHDHLHDLLSRLFGLFEDTGETGLESFFAVGTGQFSFVVQAARAGGDDFAQGEDQRSEVIPRQEAFLDQVTPRVESGEF